MRNSKVIHTTSPSKSGCQMREMAYARRLKNRMSQQTGARRNGRENGHESDHFLYDLCEEGSARGNELSIVNCQLSIVHFLPNHFPGDIDGPTFALLEIPADVLSDDADAE